MKRVNLFVAICIIILANFSIVFGQTTPVFEAKFNVELLDLNKWKRGGNCATTVVIMNSSFLQLESPVGEAWWVVTKNKYAPVNRTVSIKILKANRDGDIGICPTSPDDNATTGSKVGIYNEPNWYRFFVGLDPADPNGPPFKLYVYKKTREFLHLLY